MSFFGIFISILLISAAQGQKKPLHEIVMECEKICSNVNLNQSEIITSRPTTIAENDSKIHTTTFINDNKDIDENCKKLISIHIYIKDGRNFLSEELMSMKASGFSKISQILGNNNKSVVLLEGFQLLETFSTNMREKLNQIEKLPVISMMYASCFKGKSYKEAIDYAPKLAKYLAKQFKILVDSTPIKIEDTYLIGLGNGSYIANILAAELKDAPNNIFIGRLTALSPPNNKEYRSHASLSYKDFTEHTFDNDAILTHGDIEDVIKNTIAFSQFFIADSPCTKNDTKCHYETAEEFFIKTIDPKMKFYAVSCYKEIFDCRNETEIYETIMGYYYTPRTSSIFVGKIRNPFTPEEIKELKKIN